MIPGPITLVRTDGKRATIQTVVVERFALGSSKPAVTRQGLPVVTVDGALRYVAGFCVCGAVITSNDCRTRAHVRGPQEAS